MTWNDANERCKALDPDGQATLTSVQSSDENDYIQSLIVSFTAWIGGRDEAVEGVWR